MGTPGRYRTAKILAESSGFLMAHHIISGVKKKGSFV